MPATSLPQHDPIQMALQIDFCDQGMRKIDGRFVPNTSPDRQQVREIELDQR